MIAKEKYEKWLKFDPQTKEELLRITNNDEITDRFYRDLDFGTGGIRGIVGAGTNRVNSYTIRKVSAGLVDYLNKKYNHKVTIVIAYDTRSQSRQFAEDAATVFTLKGANVFLFEEPTPTPVLSFAVRYLQATAGIVITASHNPKEYNGYKVYNEQGIQILPNQAEAVSGFINQVDDLSAIPYESLTESVQRKKLQWLDASIMNVFLEEINKLSLYKGDLSVTYTPLYGTGKVPIQKILEDFKVYLVLEEANPDGDFPTVASPNPENPKVFDLAIEQAQLNQSDIIIGTDPDCDRIGVAVRHNETYLFLTGNQVGALLVDFVLQRKVISHRATVIKTIVTNDLGSEIAKKLGYRVVETLTGFKYIGEKIEEIEKKGIYEFVLGYEESFGYLIGSYIRDKDAIATALLICEMAAYYKQQDQTLIDRLQELYQKHGYYLDRMDSHIFKGMEGSKRMQAMMEVARERGLELFPNTMKVLDYQKRINGLPKSNVLKFFLQDGSWIAMRPSGTEPKLKIYYSIKAETEKEAEVKLAVIRKNLKPVIDTN